MQTLASACVLSSGLSNHPPLHCLTIYTPAAVTEVMFQHLWHSTPTPLAFVVLSVSKLLFVHSIWHIPPLQSVKACCQWFHTCHWDQYYPPGSAHQSISVLLEAVVSLPLRLWGFPPLGDLSSTICGWCVNLLVYCLTVVSSCVASLMASIFVPRDGRVSWDVVDHDFNALGGESLIMLIDCSS